MLPPKMHWVLFKMYDTLLIFGVLVTAKALLCCEKHRCCNAYFVFQSYILTQQNASMNLTRKLSDKYENKKRRDCTKCLYAQTISKAIKLRTFPPFDENESRA